MVACVIEAMRLDDWREGMRGGGIARQCERKEMTQ